MVSDTTTGGPDYRARLRRIGLDADQIREALGASNTQRRMCDLDHCSKSAPGYYAYNGMLTSMSRQMCGGIWERHDPFSMPLLINHREEVVVAVTSGDPYTGLIVPGECPTTRNPKGELTRGLIRQNRERNQLALIEIVETSSKKELLEKISSCTFWLVLVYFDKDKGEIRCEASLPVTSNARGFPQSWQDRIILPPYIVNDLNLGDDPNEGFDPIDVPLSSR